jgi:hypothetical protein
MSTYINLGEHIVLLDGVKSISLSKSGNILEITYQDNKKYTYDVRTFDAEELMAEIWELIQQNSPQGW